MGPLCGAWAAVNPLAERLAGGDLRSDGEANQVAEEVLAEPELHRLLLDALNEGDVIRARGAHALEVVGRERGELLRESIVELARMATQDPVPMVRWHIAMILGNTGAVGKETDLAFSTLLQLLRDENVFVRSWAVVSLTSLAQARPELSEEAVQEIRKLSLDVSAAIRAKVRIALSALVDGCPTPPGWRKWRGVDPGGMGHP